MKQWATHLRTHICLVHLRADPVTYIVVIGDCSKLEVEASDESASNGNKEFEEAANEARSESSKWVEVLVEGKLERNNTLKLAGAKQAT